jgi:hypothetical protein
MTRKQRTQSIPTIAGMPAQHLYELIEASPQYQLRDGTVHVDIRLCAEHGAQWRAAYEHMERELISEMETCANRHEHQDMLPHQWRALVTHAMADRARELLGISDPHPFWC